MRLGSNAIGLAVVVKDTARWIRQVSARRPVGDSTNGISETGKYTIEAFDLFSKTIADIHHGFYNFTMILSSFE